MLDKYQIFENIGSYTAEQIVEFINKGIVTPEELERPSNTAGEYSYEVRKKVNELLQGREPEDWQRARTVNTQEAYQQYLDVAEILSGAWRRASFRRSGARGG